MAITASAQSALQDLSWDEAIVPTLRKRLENESRAISKRMSTVSFGQDEDGPPQYAQSSTPRRPGVKPGGGRVTPSSSVNPERPSGIPRPSLNFPRPSIGSANPVSSHADNTSKNDAKRPMRSRTYSQPFAADAAQATKGNRSNGYSGQSTTRTPNALPTPASSRSNSPVFSQSPAPEENDTRPAKTTGNKRPGQNAQILNRPLRTQNKHNAQERWDVDEDAFEASYSSIVVELSPNKQNGILHEAPPFSANSSFVSEADERPSLEERPYEHWYRGDLSRNGGVGELRIGNRMEMLEIASYGHKLRGIKHDTFSRQRRRAESIGHRESVIFAEDHEVHTPMVFDEAPLTDMEADTEAETDRDQSLAHHPLSEQTPLEQPKRSEESTATRTTSASAVPATPKRRQPTQIPRTTPNVSRTTQRTASEPLQSKLLSSSTSSMSPSTPRSPRNGTAAKIPYSQSAYPASPDQKRGRAKSPGVTAANKKPRPSAAQKRSKSTGAAERLRAEPSEYPDMPDGAGSMADAIPSWTQPKKAGNWDDVVLPALARKMGLEDQYEEADGSPQAGGRPSSEVIAPQPGTFGYDPSKRRLNYDSGEEIPMEQFDRSERIEEDKNEGAMPTKPVDFEANENWSSDPFSKAPITAPVNWDGNDNYRQNPRRYEPPPSPAPFVQYQVPNSTKPEPMDGPVHIEEEKHGGCCGCIIM